ncbi:MAG: class I SAM-dependent methyltransferase [Candidatus Fermentithermobacillus carboniphilus]|uniref:Class I SAM-dependent methyltransferase n=1 Tax=Candidatus Fermentithermobacillus carboniphilus TaxID=3085328 RepID=A0AAT9LCC7_9FIRM|nr:MAG: class I SAM-dependent methyltransferase [Candidatus Fermentithermobacillus carboniphilus]
MDKKKNTSWDNVARWYNELLNKEGTYQKELILPNLLRLMAIKEGEVVLDLACGQGFFAREFRKHGARVIGVDVSKKLIDIARKSSPEDISYHVASAENLAFIEDGSVDKVAIVLAIQNIQDMHSVFFECRRVLKPEGKLYLVLNHPAFRIPGASSWGWDRENNVIYRRIDRYISESTVKIKIHPGADPRQYTLTFHRPLQLYFKVLAKAEFCVTRLEEWNSHKTSQPGPRKEAEDRARKEIPLFLYIEAAIHGSR